MTVRHAQLLSSLAAVFVTVACTSYYEIPIETPIRPKLDVSAFQRVLVAGFVSGGSLGTLGRQPARPHENIGRLHWRRQLQSHAPRARQTGW